MSFCACLVMACVCVGMGQVPSLCIVVLVLLFAIIDHTLQACVLFGWWFEEKFLAKLAILSSFAKVKAAILQDYMCMLNDVSPLIPPITEKFAVCQNFVTPNLPAIQSLFPHMHTYWEGIAVQSIRFWWAGQVWGMCLYAQRKFPMGIDVRR